MAPSRKHGGGRKNSKAVGPQYPVRLLKELGQPLDLNNRNRRRRPPKSDSDVPESVANDVYEYEEGVPQEESGKNRRFDDVDKLEYELPSDFEDEEIDEDAASGEENGGKGENLDNGVEGEGEQETEEEDEEEYDEERHDKMLEEISGRGHGNERKTTKDDDDDFEADINEHITVDDLLAPLQEKPGINALKKRMRTLQKRATPVSAPLPKVLQEKMDRKVGYAKTSEDITKWQHLVKKNREAPTENFIKKEDATLATSGALAADFKPSTTFEKEILALLQESGAHDPFKIESAENLELNKLTVDEVRQRQERLAKMRSLLFRHEERAKRIKKIKSKTFHRMERKQKMKADLLLDDPELRKEEALKQEFNRAKERMTLKHKNTSRWARRILKRGLQHHNDGTREAITEQLREHALLTRKIHSVNAASSDEEDESDVDDEPEGLVLERKPGSKLTAKERIAALKALEEGNEADLPTTGIFALPFMARAIERKRKEAQDEALAVLEQIEQANEGGTVEQSQITGKLSFGGFANKLPTQSLKEDHDLIQRGSDSENSGDEEFVHTGGMVEVSERKSASAPANIVDSDDTNLDGMVEAAFEHTTKVDTPISVQPTVTVTKKKKKKKNKISKQKGTSQSVVSTNPTEKIQSSNHVAINDKAAITVGRSKEPTREADKGDKKRKADDMKEEASPAPLATVTKKKKKKKSKNKATGQQGTTQMEMAQKSVISANPTIFGTGKIDSSGNSNRMVAQVNGKVTVAGRSKEPSREEVQGNTTQDEDDTPNEEHVEPDGNDNLIIPRTQEELIREAFAGDDVETEFQELKSEAVNEEAPKASNEILDLPGWGQWTDIQKKRGPPQWMIREQEELKRKQEEAKKRRLDAKLNNVIISEKPDKKAAKYLSSSLPFPYTSKELFEKTIRMPIGRDFNTHQAFEDLTRPSVIKKTGLIIDPIKYEKPSATQKTLKRKH